MVAERGERGGWAAAKREKKREKCDFLGFGGIYTPARSGVRMSIAAHHAPSFLSLWFQSGGLDLSFFNFRSGPSDPSDGQIWSCVFFVLFVFLHSWALVGLDFHCFTAITTPFYFVLLFTPPLFIYLFFFLAYEISAFGISYLSYYFSQSSTMSRLIFIFFSFVFIYLFMLFIHAYHIISLYPFIYHFLPLFL